jgi:hypothetical protein
VVAGSNKEKGMFMYQYSILNNAFLLSNSRIEVAVTEAPSVE